MIFSVIYLFEMEAFETGRKFYFLKRADTGRADGSVKRAGPGRAEKLRPVDIPIQNF